MSQTLRKAETVEAAGNRADHGLRLQRRPDKGRHRDLESDPAPSPAIRPALERIFDAHVDHPSALERLAKYPTTTTLPTAEKARRNPLLCRHAQRAYTRWVPVAFATLEQQTVIVPGTKVASSTLAHQARSLARAHTARAEVIGLLEALAKVSGKEQASTERLASIARLAPVTWRFGTYIRRATPPRRETRSGNGRSISPPLSRPCTTTESGPRGRTIPRPSSPRSGTGEGSCSRCSATGPSTRRSRSAQRTPRPPLAPRGAHSGGALGTSSFLPADSVLRTMAGGVYHRG